MAMTPEEKVREARLRRMAVRQRMTLHRSGRRDRRAWDYGRYWLAAPDLGVVFGAGDGTGRVGEYPGLTMDEAEARLAGASGRKQ